MSGMLTYSAAVTLDLAFIGYTSGSAGPLLWPAIALHATSTVRWAREATGRKQIDEDSAAGAARPRVFRVRPSSSQRLASGGVSSDHRGRTPLGEASPEFAVGTMSPDDLN